MRRIVRSAGATGHQGGFDDDCHPVPAFSVIHLHGRRLRSDHSAPLGVDALRLALVCELHLVTSHHLIEIADVDRPRHIETKHEPRRRQLVVGREREHPHAGLLLGGR